MSDDDRPQDRPPGRLYGRDRELRAVEGLLGRARGGRGGALTVVADAGMGKTALLDAAERGAAGGFRVLTAIGVPAEADVPYAGLHRLLRPLSDLVGELPPAFRTALAPLSGGDAPVPFVLYSAVCELLSLAARSGPVLCRVDDAQWLDRVTLEALAFAARRVGDERLAIVFAARTQAPLTGIPHLRLPPLDEEASLRILQDAVGDALGTELAEEVVDLASGCALAVRELAGGLTAAQLSGGAAPPRALPPGSVLRTLFRHRHLRLPPGAQRLVLMVAADEWLGAPTVARAARTAGIGAREIEAARESGLLRLADHAVAGDDAVVVRDRLVRSSLWAEASRAERRAAHALLAQLLVQDWQRPSRIWHRAALSGEADDRIADELAEAASTSRRAGRYGDSWQAWQRAAALTSERGARADRLLAAATDAWAGGRARRARAVLRQVRPLDQDGTRAGLAELLRGEIEAGSGSPATAVPMLRDAAERLAGTDGALALSALMWAAEAADAAGDHTAYLEIAERAATLPTGPNPPAAGAAAAPVAAADAAADARRVPPGPSRPRGCAATRPPSRTRWPPPRGARRCSGTRRSRSPPATRGCGSRGRRVSTRTPPSTSPRSRSPPRSTATGTRRAGTWRRCPAVRTGAASRAPTGAGSSAPPRSARGRPPAWTSPRTVPATPPRGCGCPAARAWRTRSPGCSPPRTWSRRSRTPATGSAPPAPPRTSPAGRRRRGPRDGSRSPAAAPRCSPSATTRPPRTTPRRSGCTSRRARCSSWPAPSCCSAPGCGAAAARAPPASTCARRCGSSSGTAPSRGRARPARSCARPATRDRPRTRRRRHRAPPPAPGSRPR
ncbi:AAA family ATPase [Actinomadura verrucosospora]|uniref:Orc1-like AAA ATPase domain-containing protein n=1 Tax=Actinomadura verrucosospora TaxID=46165 RepID=A0A7D3ZP19_ACTVE|nr:AAA family ATPase [Actinomadura verrucosospora]QKG25341.1 hypothetical protein ACTIVE_6992 [Actinomadura verrucosospora]